MQNDAPKRRRFQWSLRTLFVVVTLLASWIGFIAWTFRHDVEYFAVIGLIVVSFFITLTLCGALLTWLVAPRNRH